MNAAQTAKKKVSRSLSIDQEVAEFAESQAKNENRSFSNYVETLISNALEKKSRKGHVK